MIVRWIQLEIKEIIKIKFRAPAATFLQATCNCHEAMYRQTKQITKLVSSPEMSLNVGVSNADDKYIVLELSHFNKHIITYHYPRSSIRSLLFSNCNTKTGIICVIIWLLVSISPIHFSAPTTMVKVNPADVSQTINILKSWNTWI